MNLRPTLAVGYDVVLAIDPTTYEITEDVKGQAYAFDMTDAREGVAEAVRSVLPHPADTEHVEIEPGYVRVKIKASKETKPNHVLESLRSIPDEYNRRYATDPALDGLAYSRDVYLGTYRPEDAPAQSTFVDRHGQPDAAPDSDEPIFTYTRENAGESALKADRRFLYRIVLPFDPSIFEEENTIGGDGTPPVRWEENDALRKALTNTVEDLPVWPERAENTPHIAVYPGYLLVEHVTSHLRMGPKQLAEKAGDAFLKFNRYRRKHPPVAFSGQAYVAGRNPTEGADDWITDHDLDAVDGEPRGMDPEQEPDTEDMDGGFWDAVAKW